MTSCHGYYEFFDYDLFKVRRCPDRLVTDPTYPRGTLMGAIIQHFPRFAQLAIMAKMDRRFADAQGKFTVFISDYWEGFSAAELEMFGAEKAKEIVASNTILGRVRAEDLRTSQDAQLNAIDNMGVIHAWLDIRSGQFMIGNGSLGREINASNGIIHNVKPHGVPEANTQVSPEY